MRLATWNVNGMRARRELVLHWLRARRPDVVGLQELKLTDDQFPQVAFTAEGYRAATHGQKGWNGVAVLSRGPLAVRQSGLPGQEDRGARLLGVEAGGIVFLTVYCPNGKHTRHEDFGIKLAWLDALASWVEAHHRPQAPVVLCGDFNVCPGPLDSWNEAGLRGTLFHTEDERRRMRRLFEWGFVDVFRELHPDTRAFTWWDYRAGAFHRNEGLRIDLLLATRPLLERVRSVEIDREYRKKTEGLTASDHAPLIVDLD